MEHSRWRPSPGTAFGLLALVIAVTGTAVAGPLATTSVLNKKERKQVRRIAKGLANKQITRRAPGLSVNNAKGTEEVRNSGRVVLNDPMPGDTTPASGDLLVAGAFTIRGLCSDNQGGGGNDLAVVQVSGPSGSSFAGIQSNGAIINRPDQASFNPVNLSAAINATRHAGLTVVSPNGQVVSVSASAEVGDPAGDCVFGATAIGP